MRDDDNDYDDDDDDNDINTTENITRNSVKWAAIKIYLKKKNDIYCHSLYFTTCKL